MSAFIVISVKDSLNWIVDGIKDCRPHNPQVITYLSTGKIKKEGEDKYLYGYTVFSKHDKNRNAGNTSLETVESGIPRNLFSNQIAQFLYVCKNEGEQINIFLIDNPITDEDFEQSSWLVNEIRAVYERHQITNFQLVRVLFSYQIDKPTDVNIQVSKKILQQLTEINTDESGNFLSRILYIGNQNCNGAALSLNKEEHDIMIPRMLCDFMMLLSNKDNSYNILAAITGQTCMFAVGYAECMYYHDDVFRYYDIAGRKDLIQHLLDSRDDEESLDYEKYPIGLEDRVRRLKPKYEEVSFEEDISSFDSSIDKAIDDIIVSFKDDILGIRNDAIKIAEEQNAEAIRSECIDYLKESGKLPNGITEEDLREKYEEIASELKIDLSPVVNTAIETILKKYPKYIDRHQIYEEFLVEKENGEDFEGTPLADNIKSYDRLVCFLQTGTFKKYVQEQCETLMPSKEAQSNALVEPPKKICFLKRLFCCKKRVSDNLANQVVAQSAPKRDWHSLRVKLSNIATMLSDREKFKALQAQVLQMRKEMKDLEEELDQFRLTTHCSSVDNLIDLDKLKKIHKDKTGNLSKEVIDTWTSRRDEDKSYIALFEDLKEKTKWDVFDYYYINWEKPFEFIKEIDLASVCEELQTRSRPLVNTYTLKPIAANLTSYNFYSDNKSWNEDINQKRINLRNSNGISSTMSHHICSKICMFQFLQMDKELIDGLVDIS